MPWYGPRQADQNGRSIIRICNDTVPGLMLKEIMDTHTLWQLQLSCYSTDRVNCQSGCHFSLGQHNRPDTTSFLQRPGTSPCRAAASNLQRPSPDPSRLTLRGCETRRLGPGRERRRHARRLKLGGREEPARHITQVIRTRAHQCGGVRQKRRTPGESSYSGGDEQERADRLCRDMRQWCRTVEDGGVSGRPRLRRCRGRPVFWVSSHGLVGAECYSTRAISNSRRS